VYYSLISISISGADQETQKQRDPSQWNMPQPRRPFDDNNVGGDGTSTGAEMFAAYSNASSNNQRNGRNKQDSLVDRAKERMGLRMRQDGNNTWRDPSDRATDRLWGRSPSPPPPPVEKKKKVSRSPSSDSASTASSSSSGSSSSGDSRRKKRKSGGRGKARKGSNRKRRRSYSSSSSSSSGSSSASSESSRVEKTRGGIEKSKNRDSDKHVGKQIKMKSEPADADADADADAKSKVPNETNHLDEEDLREAREFKKAVQGDTHQSDSDDDDEGPMPLVSDGNANAAGGSQNQKAYGKALLPGEGEALAAYVQQNLRIPRRGEIGYDAAEIDHYENSGYVMSGSRHARMNAVRIRKENQVYSAEEQRALALITLEENQQKEAALLSDFRTMLKEKQSILAEKNKQK